MDQTEELLVLRHQCLKEIDELYKRLHSADVIEHPWIFRQIKHMEDLEVLITDTLWRQLV